LNVPKVITSQHNHIKKRNTFSNLFSKKRKKEKRNTLWSGNFRWFQQMVLASLGPHKVYIDNKGFILH